MSGLFSTINLFFSLFKEKLGSTSMLRTNSRFGWNTSSLEYWRFQGPFETDQMKEWFSNGLVPLKIKAKRYGSLQSPLLLLPALIQKNNMIVLIFTILELATMSLSPLPTAQISGRLIPQSLALPPLYPSPSKATASPRWRNQQRPPLRLQETSGSTRCASIL